MARLVKCLVWVAKTLVAPLVVCRVRYFVPEGIEGDLLILSISIFSLAYLK